MSETRQHPNEYILNRNILVKLFLTDNAIELRRILNKDNINSTFDSGDSILHVVCACRYHNVEMISWIISLGADINGLNKGFQMPLHIATFESDLVMMEILLKLGSHARSRDKRSTYSPLYFSIMDRSYDCMNILLRRGANLTDSEHRTDPTEFCKNRLNYTIECNACRKKAQSSIVAFIGLKRFNKSAVLRSNHMDVIKMIAQHVWVTCIDPIWK